MMLGWTIPKEQTEGMNRMARPRHPNKDIEAVIQEAEALGWRVLVGGSHAWGFLYVLWGAVPRRVPVARLVDATRPVRPCERLASGHRPLRALGGGPTMSQVASRVFDFTLILDTPGEFTVEMADRLYEAGCDDATFGTINGTHFGRFHREAGCLGDAIGSAVKDVERAGLKVAGIDVGGGIKE